MKKLLLFLVFGILLNNIGLGQDTIIKHNDELIFGKIYRLNSERIYYTPLGDDYPNSKSIRRAEVKDIRNLPYGLKTVIEVDSLLKDKSIIIHKSGLGIAMYVDERRLKNQELKSLFSNYPGSFQDYGSGKIMKLFGAIIGISGGVLVGVGFLVTAGNEQVNMPILALGGVGLVSGLALSNGGNKKIKKAINSYNTLIEEEPKVSLEFGIQTSGLGLALRF